MEQRRHHSKVLKLRTGLGLVSITERRDLLFCPYSRNKNGWPTILSAIYELRLGLGLDRGCLRIRGVLTGGYI